MIEKAQVVVVNPRRRVRVIIATVITAVGVAGGTEVVAPVAGVDSEPVLLSLNDIRGELFAVGDG
jgi:hypothetical protein